MNIESAREAFRHGNAVLVCGAGISVNPPATLPDWKALRDETVRAVAGADEELLGLTAKLLERELISVPGSRGLAPEVVASTVSSVTAAYFDALTALRGSEPNANHTLIARAARRGLLRYIVSTNWDDLIETALVKENVGFRVFRTNDEFAAWEPEAESHDVQLYKIHGCLTKPESITARLEDEARGLPEGKAAVLRWLLNRSVFLFWGYSGADLKLDLDYLQMVRCRTSAPGFVWNLHAGGDYREAPSPYVVALTEMYGDRGAVAHGALPELLNELLGRGERISLTQASLDEVTALRRKRTEELRKSLASWAASNLDWFARLEVMALLLQQSGEWPGAARCYERLRALSRPDPGSDYRVAWASAQAMRLYLDLGDVETAELYFRRVDDTARTHGDLHLVAEAGLTLAEIMRRTGQLLPACRAYGYGKTLLRGMGDEGRELEERYELGIGDTFVDLGQFDLALQRYEHVERRARADGRLAVVASVLARRGWLSELRDDFAEAAASLRAADEIARSLGLRREHAVWSLRLSNLEGNLNELAAAKGGSPTDDVESHNALRDNAVAYAREAGDPLLFMQASLDAAIKRGVPVPVTAIAEAEKRLDEVEAFARASGYRRLLLDVASRRAWLRTGASQREEALVAIEDALEIVASVRDDGLAAGLLEMKATILLDKQADARDLLDCAERLAALERKRGRAYPGLETTLVRLRREIGLGKYPASIDELRHALTGRDPGIGEFLESIAQSQGFRSWQTWGNALESEHGRDWASFCLVYTMAVQCRELRLQKQAGITIRPLAAIRDVARSWADYQLAAVTANALGLALMTLGEFEEALRNFEEAALLAADGKDEAEMLDDWFNAAGACEQLKRYDKALEHYGRVLEHPRAKRDPAMALETSLRYGEVSKIRGNHKVASTHFEAAECLVRAMGRSQRLVQVVQRLGKVHFDLEQYEASIRYRLEAGEILEAEDQALGAGSMFWLVANTYLTKLGRPRDAIVHYRRASALLERANAADQLARLRPDGDRCAELARAGDGPPTLYALLTDFYEAHEERDRLLLRIAAGMGFNLWKFEPQSFAAYCDGGQLVKLPPPASEGQPVRFPIRWPVVLSTIAGAADYEKQKGNLRESAKLLEIMAQVAKAWSLPPGFGAGLLGRTSLGTSGIPSPDAGDAG